MIDDEFIGGRNPETTIGVGDTAAEVELLEDTAPLSPVDVGDAGVSGGPVKLRKLLLVVEVRDKLFDDEMPEEDRDPRLVAEVGELIADDELPVNTGLDVPADVKDVIADTEGAEDSDLELVVEVEVARVEEELLEEGRPTVTPPTVTLSGNPGGQISVRTSAFGPSGNVVTI